MEGEALGELKLPDAVASDAESWILHPAMMDLATGFAMDLIEAFALHEHFNHNDLYHVVQMAGTYLLYRTGLAFDR